MFDKSFTDQEIECNLIKRSHEIKNIDKLPELDSSYLNFLAKFREVEITPDIIIFGYERALKENKYLEENYPEIAKKVWIIGCTGQGDEWFLNKEKTILFYDHNQGEYTDIKQFLSFEIDFNKFLSMAFLYKKLEDELDKNENLSEDEQEMFKKIINSLNNGLYNLYPFKYF